MSNAAWQDSRWRWMFSAVVVLALHASAFVLLHEPAASPSANLAEPVLLELAPAPDISQTMPQRPLAPTHVTQPRALAPIPILHEAAAPLPRPRSTPAHATFALEAPPAPLSAEPVLHSAPDASPQATSPSPAAMATWQARLVAHIAGFKNFPIDAQRRHEQGVVLMRFTMDRTGHVLSTILVRGSGYADLDSEAQAWIARADPMPPPPASGQPSVNIVLPLHFTLR